MVDIASEDVRSDLLAVLKLSAKKGESAAEFTARVVGKAQKCPEEVWNQLQEPTQVWVNGWIAQEEQSEDELPLLLDYDAAELSGEEELGAEAVETEPTQISKKEKETMSQASTKAKAAKKAKGNGTPAKKKEANGRGRGGPFALDASIKILKQPEFRAGSVRQKVFDNYKAGMTVAQARTAGVPYNHMRWHVEQGWIKVA